MEKQRKWAKNKWRKAGTMLHMGALLGGAGGLAGNGSGPGGPGSPLAGRSPAEKAAQQVVCRLLVRGVLCGGARLQQAYGSRATATAHRQPR